MGSQYELMLDRVLAKPRPHSEEWVATFQAFTAEVEPGAADASTPRCRSSSSAGVQSRTVHADGDQGAARGGGGRGLRRIPLLQLRAHRRGGARQPAVRDLPLQVRLPRSGRRRRHHSDGVPALSAARRLHAGDQAPGPGVEGGVPPRGEDQGPRHGASWRRSRATSTPRPCASSRRPPRRWVERAPPSAWWRRPAISTPASSASTRCSRAATSSASSSISTPRRR